MKLLPDFNEKWAKFRKNRRAYASLLILAVLFLVSLPAELLFNDKPLAMKLDGAWYFPVFRDYTWSEFGDSSDMRVDDYKGAAWRDFVAGRRADSRVMAARLYGDAAVAAPAQPAPPPRPHTVSYLWPLVVHSHKSTLECPAVERSREMLIPPGEFHSQMTETAYVSEDGVLTPEERTLYIKEPGGAGDGFWVGTDSLGKDVFARLVYSFRLALLFGLGLTLVGYIVGSVIGAIQGFFGGWVDLVGQRIIEIWGSIPQLYVLMILSGFLASRAELTPMKQGLLLFAILSLTSWMSIDAYMRAEFLRARNLEYVKAARALGQSDFRIMFKHILPNSLTPIITFLPFSVSANMLALTSLDFLGLGLKYPAPSLGELLSQGEAHLDAWWILLPTFAVIGASLLLLNFVGEGLRNAFDPRVK
jgi:ABC-type microcin C transport system permease subunit YejE